MSIPEDLLRLTREAADCTPNGLSGRVKFLLITVPRSGTMMVTNALEADPHVRMYNFFASNPDLPWNSQALLTEFQWKIHSPEVTHVGTTMHFIGPEWANRNPLPLAHVWPMLAACHDRYVVLYRENLLRQYLSLLVGRLIDTYDVLQPRETKPIPPPATIDLAELQEQVSNVYRLLELRHFFPGRLQLSYELLASNWNRCYSTMREYLGLPFVDKCHPLTVKQEHRPLREAIANYDEVASWCALNDHSNWLNENEYEDLRNLET